MTKDEALKLALEALENVAVTGPDDDGIVWINLPGNGTTGKAILRVGKAGLIAAQCAQLYEEQRTKAITAIKQALAAPVQEPVAEVTEADTENYKIRIIKPQPAGTKLYTTPPAQRQWVGLTDEDIYPLLHHEPRHDLEMIEFIRIVETKLKELNT